MSQRGSVTRLATSAAIAVGVLTAALLPAAAAPIGGEGHRHDAAVAAEARVAQPAQHVIDAALLGPLGPPGTEPEPWRGPGSAGRLATTEEREAATPSAAGEDAEVPPAASPASAVAADTPSAAGNDGRDDGPEPVHLRLPAQSLEAEVVPVALDDERRLEVPEAHLAGWYIHRSVPGAVGPAVIVGHVDGPDGPAVFFDLPEAEPGDTVEVVLDDDLEVTYEVDRVEVHPKEAFPTDAVYGPTDEPELRLITCGGPFDPVSRSYRDNVIVFAQQRE